MCWFVDLLRGLGVWGSGVLGSWCLGVWGSGGLGVWRSGVRGLRSEGKGLKESTYVSEYLHFSLRLWVPTWSCSSPFEMPQACRKHPCKSVEINYFTGWEIHPCPSVDIINCAEGLGVLGSWGLKVWGQRPEVRRQRTEGINVCIWIPAFFFACQKLSRANPLWLFAFSSWNFA